MLLASVAFASVPTNSDGASPLLPLFQPARRTVPAPIPYKPLVTLQELGPCPEKLLTPDRSSEKPSFSLNGSIQTSEKPLLTWNEAGLSTESPLLTWSEPGQSFEKLSLAPSGLCPRKPRQHGPTAPVASQDAEGAALIEELERMKLAADEYYQMTVVRTAENLIAETNDMERKLQFSQYLPRDSQLKEEVRLNHIAQSAQPSGQAASILDLFRSAQQPSNSVTQFPQPSDQAPSLMDLFLAAQQPK